MFPQQLRKTFPDARCDNAWIPIVELLGKPFPTVSSTFRDGLPVGKVNCSVIPEIMMSLGPVSWGRFTGLSFVVARSYLGVNVARDLTKCYRQHCSITTWLQVAWMAHQIRAKRY